MPELDMLVVTEEAVSADPIIGHALKIESLLLGKKYLRTFSI